MNEIAKCPICGENPNWFPIAGWESGWKTDMLMCCGYGSTSVKGWNKYAAAMELAKWTINIHSTSSVDMPIPDIIDKFIAAEDRVLEVFK